MSTTTIGRGPTFIDRVEEALTEMRSFKRGLDRKLYMMERWPRFPERFWDNHMGTLVRLDAVQLVSFIGYPDPVGERAARNVDLERAS